ncbi:hypothetical protein ACIRF8_15655 [Streptomyces sp. NPDC102406]|uniref:phage fiber-tail adaptor protein n=1 Tax=Streptomyces sp. NPDC102406 TaxID=3366171 RepID=UPI00380D4709
MSTDSISTIKDSVSRLDYHWNWAPWLAQINDTLSEATVLVPAGLTAVGPPTVNAGLVTQRIAGGDIDTTYKVTCQITTVGGLIDERSQYIQIMER